MFSRILPPRCHDYVICYIAVLFRPFSVRQHMHSHPFLSHPFCRAIICSIFSRPKVFPSRPLNVARSGFYLNARPLYTIIFILSTNVRFSPRVLSASWRSAHLYFFENRRRILPRAKSSAKRIERLELLDKRETRLKKPNFHAVVKHLRSVSCKIHGFAALYNLRFWRFNGHSKD